METIKMAIAAQFKSEEHTICPDISCAENGHFLYYGRKKLIEKKKRQDDLMVCTQLTSLLALILAVKCSCHCSPVATLECKEIADCPPKKAWKITDNLDGNFDNLIAVHYAMTFQTSFG